MATAYHNLSDYDFNSVPSAENMKFGIVVSEWNYNITGALLKGAVDTLKKHGAKDENIMIKTVPGSFELTFGTNQIIEYSEVDADVIKMWRISTNYATNCNNCIHIAIFHHLIGAES